MKQLLSVIIALISLTGTFRALADNTPIGSWNYFSAYSHPCQEVVDTPDKVYYLSGGSLFSYDKKNDESYAYTLQNKLNDSYITDIFYNKNKKFLLIAYDTGNIDVLYDDGKVVNMSDIMDAELNVTKTINYVCFDADRVYVATAFGLIVFDADRHEVIETGIYNKNVNVVAVVGDHVVINIDWDMLVAGKSESIKHFDKFYKIATYAPIDDIHVCSDNEIIIRIYTRDINYTEIDFENRKLKTDRTLTPSESPQKNSKILNVDSDGILYMADNIIYSVDENFNSLEVAELPEEFDSCVIGSSNPAKSVWSINHYGLANHKFDSDGGVTVLMQRFCPDNFSVKKAYYMFPTRDNSYLYVQNLGTTSYKYGFKGERGLKNIQNASRINLSSGDTDDVTLYPVNTKHNTDRYWDLGKYANACSSMVPDEDDHEVYYLSSAEDGVFKVKNGELLGLYNETNSPIEPYDGRVITYGVNVDRGGNLWVAALVLDNSEFVNPIFVLPSAKRKLNPAEVKKEDWIIPPAIAQSNYLGGQDVVFLNSAKSDVILILDSNPDQVLAAYDTRGTYNDFSDDKLYVWNRFTDQDGKTFKPDRQISIAEDHDGKIWFGTNIGVIEIPSAAKAMDPSMTINRLKVPRNDGTNLADYLLGTDYINSIAVDAANRKWLATDVSGLYLVSPDGHQILERFYTNNSPLRSNRVNALYSDPNSTTLYVGTEYGLYTYGTNAAPSRPDYSDICAFPNPVRPDYSGPVYVKGLMEGSLVKIADTAGNVVAQGRSEGGLFTWDGCNMSGSRVKTGVYYVFVSENSSGSSSGAVTKIMVIN